MIREHGKESIRGRLLVNGTGLGQYQSRLAQDARLVVGLDIELPRLIEAKETNENLVCAQGEHLPFESGHFDAVLSNEVLEHVQDDRAAVREIARALNVGGRFILFCPNRGYPFETHGIFWNGKYRFGNKFFVNYLPNGLRDKLAPHVRVYTRRGLCALTGGLGLTEEFRTTIFGGYDNIVQRFPTIGKVIRGLLQFLEKTPLNRFGLSHFWVMRRES